MQRAVSLGHGKPILTAEAVAEIIESLKPGIAGLLKLYKREFLHVVVLDPVDGTAILFDEPVGGSMKDYPKPYNEVALAKARLCARTGLDTAAVTGLEAHLMCEGDVLFQGGVNYRGLVVAASGAPAPVDEAVALMIAVSLSAWCQVKVQEWQKGAFAGGAVFAPASLAAA